MDIDKYQKKLERQHEVLLGRVCTEWMEKIGNDFFEAEKADILKSLESAMPGELVNIQARWKELQRLRNRLNSTMNKGKESERKLQNENRRE